MEFRCNYLLFFFLFCSHSSYSQIDHSAKHTSNFIKEEFIQFNELTESGCVMLMSDGNRFTGTAFMYEYLSDLLFLNGSFDMAQDLPDSLLKIIDFKDGLKSGRAMIIHPENGEILYEKIFNEKMIQSNSSKYIFKFKQIDIEYGDLGEYVYFIGSNIYSYDSIKMQYEIIKESINGNGYLIDSLFGSHNLEIFSDNYHLSQDTSEFFFNGKKVDQVKSWAGKYLELTVSDGYGALFEPYGHLYSQYEAYTQLFEPKYCGQTKIIKDVKVLDSFPYRSNISDFPYHSIERYNEYERRGWRHDKTTELD